MRTMKRSRIFRGRSKRSKKRAEDPSPSEVLTLEELAERLGTTVAALRHEISRGFLPHAMRTGQVGGFTTAHLHYGLAVQRLRAEGVRGPALAQRLEGATPEQIRALAGVSEPETPASSDAIDALLWVAAEALDALPRNARAALAAICRRMRDARLTPEQVARGLARPATSGASAASSGSR